jgi:hypothetical protein
MSRMIFAYFGPETVLPLTSMVAAAIGFLMMFGRHLVRLSKLAIGRVWHGRRKPLTAWKLDRNLRRDALEPAGTPHPMAQPDRVRS